MNWIQVRSVHFCWFLEHPQLTLTTRSNFCCFLCQKHTFLKNCLKIPLPMQEADLAFIFKKKTKPRSGRISKISIQSLASSFPFEDSGGLALPWNNYIIKSSKSLRLEKNQHLKCPPIKWHSKLDFIEPKRKILSLATKKTTKRSFV